MMTIIRIKATIIFQYSIEILRKNNVVRLRGQEAYTFNILLKSSKPGSEGRAQHHHCSFNILLKSSIGRQRCRGAITIRNFQYSIEILT